MACGRSKVIRSDRLTWHLRYSTAIRTPVGFRNLPRKPRLDVFLPDLLNCNSVIMKFISNVLNNVSC